MAGPAAWSAATTEQTRQQHRGARRQAGGRQHLREEQRRRASSRRGTEHAQWCLPQASKGDREEHGEEQAERPRILDLGLHRRRRRQRFAGRDRHHAFEAGNDAAGHVAGFECRQDGVIDDAFAGRVGQHPLEAIADFDAYAPIGGGDDQQRTVVELLAPQTPGFRYAQPEHLDRLVFGGRQHEQRDLRAAFGFEGPEFRFECRTRCGIEHADQIGHPRGQRRHGDFRRRTRRPQQQPQQQPQQPRQQPRTQGVRARHAGSPAQPLTCCRC